MGGDVPCMCDNDVVDWLVGAAEAGEANLEDHALAVSIDDLDGCG